MADSGSRASSESDCNGDPKLGPVDPGYAEIIVVRHGETAWNADGRIQVCGNTFVSLEIRLVYLLIGRFPTILSL
ncbi:unnamed protein product, partial [Vitis vinifera]